MSDVDNAGHRYGPGSSQVADAIKTVDRAIGRLLDGIETLPVRQQVYVVVVSDHGMTESAPEQYVAIESLIDMEGVRVADSGPNANLHIKGGRQRAVAIRNELNRKLQHGRAYLRSEIPLQFHYRADRRIGDLVIVMDEHYQIGTKERTPKEPGGSHGWNPKLTAMHGIFLASGPGIKKGATIPRFPNVDIYPMMTELLKLKPAKQLDGRRGRLRKLIMKR
jgi:predicted AlkP superfamily pyrophosphatase or phosphodiesterase